MMYTLRIFSTFAALALVQCAMVGEKEEAAPTHAEAATEEGRAEKASEAEQDEKSTPKAKGGSKPSPCGASPESMALKAIKDNAQAAIKQAGAVGVDVADGGSGCDSSVASKMVKLADCTQKIAQQQTVTVEKETVDDETWYEDAMQSVQTQQAPCDASAAPPCLGTPPMSMLEDKAKKDATTAKVRLEEFQEAEERAQKYLYKAKRLHEKAESSKTVALESYRKAGVEAVEVAKARVAAATAMAVVSTEGEQTQSENSFQVSQEAKKKVLEAEQTAMAAETKVKEVTSNQAQITACINAKQVAKNKAECQAKMARDVSSRIASSANTFKDEMEAGNTDKSALMGPCGR